VHILIAFLIEKSAVSLMTIKKPTSDDVKILHFMNLTVLLIGAMANSWYKIWQPVVSCTPLFMALIVFLKLISYALVNADLRHLSFIGRAVEKPTQHVDDTNFDPNSVLFPDNIQMTNLIYFILAPTLVITEFLFL
jgi:diacylglycerol O-acyltransferase-1